MQPTLARDGFMICDYDPRVAAWAAAALDVAKGVAADPAMRDTWLRHGGTWFVGVDALPNDDDGAVGGVPFAGPWDVPAPGVWHRAQLSVVYPGYPRQDAGDTDAAHRFRVNRSAAHVDGLLLEGGRRFAREPHAFILGLPLNDSAACPLVVWRGSHLAMRAALAACIGDRDPRVVDVTDTYKAARAEAFADCAAVEIVARPGQAVLVDRHAVHGVASWRNGMQVPDEGRMIAYFRPLCADPMDWLRG